MDEKDISPLSLVDAVLRDSSLTQRPTQTKVELTSSRDTPSTAGGVVQESGVKSENAGQERCVCSLFLDPPSLLHAHPLIHPFFSPPSLPPSLPRSLPPSLPRSPPSRRTNGGGSSLLCSGRPSLH